MSPGQKEAKPKRYSAASREGGRSRYIGVKKSSISKYGGWKGEPALGGARGGAGGLKGQES